MPVSLRHFSTIGLISTDIQAVRLNVLISCLLLKGQRLNDPVPYEEFLRQEHANLRFIAHCERDEKMDLKRRVAADQDVVILIGPEGDFTRPEIDAAYNRGFLPVSLGESRLRTETAALVACVTVNLINSG